MTLQIPNDLTKQSAMPVPTPTLDAKELTKGGTIANILLDDKSYVLRITRAGKLILTK
jgi:hemin uptake protein HemP